MKKLFYCTAFVLIVIVAVISLNKKTGIESILSSNVEALTENPDGDGTKEYWRYVYPYNSTGSSERFVSTWKNLKTGSIDNVGGYPSSDYQLLVTGNACKVWGTVNLVPDGKCWPNI